MSLFRLVLVALLVLPALIAARAVAATPPALVPVQGGLRTSGGGPVPDGAYGLLLKLYDGPAPAAQVLWSQVEFAVPVSHGTFQAVLGKGEAGPGQLPADLFTKYEQVWLGVTVAGEAELPRVQLLAVPFALRATSAAQADYAQLADAAAKAKLADKAAFADNAEEAKIAFVAETAKGLACTGCVALEALAPAALQAGNHVANWGGQKSNVQTALDGADSRLAVYEQALPVKNGKVGAGVADPQCGLDVAEICQAGKTARLVVDVQDAQDLAKLTTAGAVAYRLDTKAFYGRAGDKWRKLAFEAECGNGLVEPGEDCEDGNQTDTDACTNACKAAKCGDGIVQAGVEGCDDGNTVDTDACTKACQPAKCGDGAIQAGVETCDGANVGGQTCKSVVNGSGTLACKADCKGYDTSNCADTTWMLTTDNCGGFRQSTYNADVRYAVSASNVWDKAKKYGCPDGYHWASTAEGQAIFKTNSNTSGVHAYYGQCGWNGYTWEGKTRYYFRFSDSAATNAYKHAGNYDEYQVQTESDTNNFGGIVCLKN